MAVSNSAHSSFYSLVGGKFRKKVSKETEGAIKRINKKGVEVWELCFDKMEGLIVKIEIKDNKEFGQTLSINFDDGDILSMIFDSKHAQTFAKVLPNINEKEQTQFATWIDKEGQTAFCIFQNEQPIKWAFTKDNPNGMPKAKKKMKLGKEAWDFTEVVNFLYENTLEEIKRFHSEVVDNREDNEQKSNEVGDDELPF